MQFIEPQNKKTQTHGELTVVLPRTSYSAGKADSPQFLDHRSIVPSIFPQVSAERHLMIL